jgi:hypothetical protein
VTLLRRLNEVKHTEAILGICFELSGASPTASWLKILPAHLLLI